VDKLKHAGGRTNDAYYREVLRTQKLMPTMREVCDEFFTFQQGNVPAHRARETINFLDERHLRSFHQTLGPNSTDLNSEPG